MSNFIFNSNSPTHPPLLRFIIISQHLLTCKWAFSCIWTSTASQAGNRLPFQLPVQLCRWALVHVTANTYCWAYFSPKHLTLSPEQEEKWLNWDG